MSRSHLTNHLLAPQTSGRTPEDRHTRHDRIRIFVLDSPRVVEQPPQSFALAIVVLLPTRAFPAFIVLPPILSPFETLRRGGHGRPAIGQVSPCALHPPLDLGAWLIPPHPIGIVGRSIGIALEHEHGRGQVCAGRDRGGISCMFDIELGVYRSWCGRHRWT